MLFFLQNFLKAIFFGLFCVVTVQASHDFNENSQLETLSDSFAFEQFLSKKHISEEFKSIYEYEKEDLGKKLCANDWPQDFFEKKLSNYLTTEKIQEDLPKLYALTDKLCRKILQTSQYSLKIKLGFDDAGNKIGYNAQAKNILAHTGMNKYIATYPTQDSPFHSKTYSFCIQLGYELLSKNSDISLERTIAHEIGHIKHEHSIKKRFYYQLNLLAGLLIPFFLSYYFFSENFCLPILIIISISLSIISLYFFEKKISNPISRYHELEADATSIEALLSNSEIIRNNYDILQIIEFIRQEEKSIESGLSINHTNTTHPLPEKRFQVMFEFAKSKLGESNQPSSKTE